MQRDPFQLLLSLLLFLADGLPGFSSLFVYMKNRKEPNQAQFLSREIGVSRDLSPHSCKRNEVPWGRRGAVISSSAAGRMHLMVHQAMGGWPLSLE